MAGKRKLVLFLLLIALALGGCGRDSGTKDSTKGYKIYYTNLTGTRLVEKEYVPSSDRFDGILSELLAEFTNPAYSDVISAMPLGVSINSYTMGVDDLLVDFNASYLGISNVQEVLLRAGLVKTLVQLPGVARVRLTVDGQPLRDSDGREVAAMNEDTFIDNQGNGINSYHYVTLNLYFSNATGDKVVKEMRNVFYSSNLIMEKVIVEQIIHGPANEKLLPVVDPSVLVKNVQISKDICIIDLDSKFNTVPGNGVVEPETCLYAFVNAICDACDVEGVQFRIEGESDVRFRGQINLDQVFYRDADIIEATGVSEPLAEIFLDEKGAETETVWQAQAEAASQEVQTVEKSMEEETESGSTSSGEKTENVIPEVSYSDQEEESGAPDPEDLPDNSSSAGGSPNSSANGLGVGKGIGVDPALMEDDS